jgi:transposase
VNRAADQDPKTLRISLDAKATVKVGPFARGGKSRAETRACDHDFKPEASVTPVGLFLPKTDEFFVYDVTSKVTSDCLVDCLLQWWQAVQHRFAHITMLVINLDNGPENHSRRTQFMQRIVEFVRQTNLTVRLAYYPPYHSKYNSVERCWGILENHWNGSILDTVETVLKFTASMTWKGIHPTIELVTTVYRTGVKLPKNDMALLENQFVRLPGLGKWFIDIAPTACRKV